MSATINNLDPKEIQRFSSLAERWWDTAGPMKPLHLLNPIRLTFIKEHCALARKRCLDVGCGGGILSEALAKEGGAITAIDASEELIDVAKQHAIADGLSIDYQHRTAEKLTASCPELFPIICCMELLEHVPDPRALIHTCQSLLAPEGLLFISTINRNLASFFVNIIGAEYLTGILPKGTHHYAQFIKPSEISCWAEACGLQVTAIKGIRYLPLSKKFIPHNGASTNYMMCLKRTSNKDAASSKNSKAR